MKFQALLLLLPLLAFALADKKQQPRPAEIELTDVSVHREGGQVDIDGKLRNTGERAAKKLKIYIDFRDPDAKVISTREGGIEQSSLDPEGEAEFHAQVPDSVRAVDVVFRYEDGSGRDLKGINAGPFTIE